MLALFYLIGDITNQNREQHSAAISKLETKLNDTKKLLKNEEIDRLDRTSMVEAREAKLRELREEMERENKEAEAELEGMIQKFRDFEHVVLKENNLFMESISKA